MDTMQSNAPVQNKKTKKQFGGKYLKQRKKRKFLSFLGKTVSFFLATVLLIAVGLVGVIYVVEKGPSTSVRDLFVRSVRETSAAGFLAEFFLTEEEIAEIEQ